MSEDGEAAERASTIVAPRPAERIANVVVIGALTSAGVRVVDCAVFGVGEIIALYLGAAVDRVTLAVGVVRD